jgi:hypothetical protein
MVIASASLFHSKYQVDEDNIQLSTLMNAARVLGRELHIELV